jgi:hypothetical protein
MLVDVRTPERAAEPNFQPRRKFDEIQHFVRMLFVYSRGIGEFGSDQILVFRQMREG